MSLKAYKLGFGMFGKIGSCAITSVVYKNKIYTANCGDSKAILVSEEKK